MTDGSIPALVQFLASLGVGGVLAYAMFHVHRKDTHDWQSALVAQRDAWKQQAELLLAIVKENSMTIATNTAATRQNTEMLVLIKGDMADALARAGVLDRREHLRG